MFTYRFLNWNKKAFFIRPSRVAQTWEICPQTVRKWSKYEGDSGKQFFRRRLTRGQDWVSWQVWKLTWPNDDTREHRRFTAEAPTRCVEPPVITCHARFGGGPRPAGGAICHQKLTCLDNTPAPRSCPAPGSRALLSLTPLKLPVSAPDSPCGRWAPWGRGWGPARSAVGAVMQSIERMTFAFAHTESDNSFLSILWVLLKKAPIFQNFPSRW